MKKLVIFGAGSVGQLAIQITQDINAVSGTWEIVGILDDNPSIHNAVIQGIPVVGGADWLANHPDVYVVLAIGESAAREKTAARIASLTKAVKYATLVHPRSWVGEQTTVGAGSILYPGALVDPNVCIGEHVILNKNATIGHDSILECCITASPGVNIGGNVRIGRGCELGINSATIQGVTIGEYSIIGGGAIVVRDIPANVTAVGIPARPIKKRSASQP